MQLSQKINPCLWFDHQAEPAAQFYVSIFKNSRILDVSRYPGAGEELHRRPKGSVMVVAFELDGVRFVGLNGGPAFKFTEAISLQINCDNQEEVDYYWSKLTADGGSPGPCGWLKDKFGLSWQVVPTLMTELFSSADTERANKAMSAMLKMQKIDIAAIERAVG